MGNEQYGREYLRALDLLDDLEAPENNRRRWNRELRTEVAHLGIEAYRQGEISRGRLLEVGKPIDFQGDELLVLAEAASGSERATVCFSSPSAAAVTVKAARTAP